MRFPCISRLLVCSLFFTIVLAAPATSAADPILDVTRLFQNDFSDLIDSSERSIAEFGCTLTAFAMLFNYEMGKLGLHSRNADGTRGDPLTYSPADLNTLLNDYRYDQPIYEKDPATGRSTKVGSERKNGWGLTIGPDGQPVGSTTDINVGALLRAVGQASKAQSFESTGLKNERFRGEPVPEEGRTVDATTREIRDQLDNGRPLVARVDDNQHTVLIIGWDDVRGYIIADPFRDADGSSASELSTYQNRIFGLDWAVFRGGGTHLPFESPAEYEIPLDALTDPSINPELWGPHIVRANHVPEPSILALFLAGLIAARTRELTIRRITASSPTSSPASDRIVRATDPLRAG